MANAKRRPKPADGDDQMLAIGWYSPDAWQKLRRHAADAHSLDDTYEEWLANAERLLNSLHAKGIRAGKYYVDVDHLRAWCDDQGLLLTGEARSRYIADQCRRECK